MALEFLAPDPARQQLPGLDLLNLVLNLVYILVYIHASSFIKAATQATQAIRTKFSRTQAKEAVRKKRWPPRAVSSLLEVT